MANNDADKAKKDINEIYSAFNNLSDSLKQAFQAAGVEIEKITQKSQDLADSISKGAASADMVRKYYTELRQQLAKAQQALATFRNTQGTINDLTLKKYRLDIESQKINNELNRALRQGNNTLAQRKMLELTNKEIEIEQTKEFIKQQQELEKVINLLQQKSTTDKENKALEAANSAKQEKSMQALTGALGTIGIQLEVFSSIAKFFTFLLGVADKLDKSVTKFARQSVISKNAAMETADAYFQVAQRVENLTRMDAYEAAAELGAALKTNAQFTADQAVAQARLTRLVGLTTEQGAGLLTIGAQIKENQYDTAAAVVEGAIQFGKMNDRAVDLRAVTAEVANNAAVLLVDTRASVEEMGAIVAQAQQLGLEFKTLQSLEKGTLNFEQSIENELKAELITGRELNLERMRAAALTADHATFMSELAEQAGSLAEYSQMNVIAQESLAQAFGLNKDSMSEMLAMSELQQELGDLSGKSYSEITQLAKDRGISEGNAALKLMEQKAASESIQIAMTKLADAVNNLGGDGITRLLQGIQSIVQMFEVIQGIAIGLVAIFTVDLVRSVMMGTRALTPFVGSLISAATAAGITNSMLTFGVGIAAAYLATQAISALINSVSTPSVEDASFDPNGGYVVSKPMGGLLKPIAQGRNDDYAVLTTNNPQQSQTSGGGGGNISVNLMLDNRAVIANQNVNYRSRLA